MLKLHRTNWHPILPVANRVGLVNWDTGRRDVKLMITWLFWTLRLPVRDEIFQGSWISRKANRGVE